MVNMIYINMKSSIVDFFTVFDGKEKINLALNKGLRK